VAKSVHPFPARMAPGLALTSLENLERGSVILDPMCGSGTVLRQAVGLGHKAIGFDVDPLAVLMANVWTTPVDDVLIERRYAELMGRYYACSDYAELPWADGDQETSRFMKYWFAEKQAVELRRLAAALHELKEQQVEGEECPALRVLSLNLSRIIVTKEQAASLARDTSHSRPHRVATESEYDVLAGYERSLTTLRRRIREAPPPSGATVTLGDARGLSAVVDGTVDAVVTSPPYLNAIDYLRGHRMALVWLGWRVGELRQIRSGSIGAERGLGAEERASEIPGLVKAMVGDAAIPARHLNMVERYAVDLWRMTSEVRRVLKSEGSATFVVGNSCLKGAFIKNADGVAAAAKALGFELVDRSERDLPQGSRWRFLEVRKSPRPYSLGGSVGERAVSGAKPSAERQGGDRTSRLSWIVGVETDVADRLGPRPSGG